MCRPDLKAFLCHLDTALHWGKCSTTLAQMEFLPSPQGKPPTGAPFMGGSYPHRVLVPVCGPIQTVGEEEGCCIMVLGALYV